MSSLLRAPTYTFFFGTLSAHRINRGPGSGCYGGHNVITMTTECQKCAEKGVYRDTLMTTLMDILKSTSKGMNFKSKMKIASIES